MIITTQGVMLLATYIVSFFSSESPFTYCIEKPGGTFSPLFSLHFYKTLLVENQFGRQLMET